MIKQLITAASFTLGSAGVVLVGYLQANPSAFTHPVAPLPWATGNAAPAAEVVALRPVRRAIVMPDVPITTTLRRAVPAAEETLTACSGYRDVGAVFIEPSGATGVRGVRELCLSDARP
jgi:hypothetical protein